LKAIQIQRPNILITDVEMGDGTGMELISLIPDIDFPIIFITAYNKYAVDAFKFSAIDFLLKPIETSELVKAINKALENINTKNMLAQLSILKESLQSTNIDKKIVLKDNSNVYFIKLSEIVYCEADGNYTSFCLSSGKKIIISKSIGEYETILENFKFVRPHHSFLVNQEHIKSFSKNDGALLLMSNGIEIPVSQRKKDKIFGLLMSE